ncbi:MAG: TetR/AcrR family transcriptional regulator [Endomicrobium sp.]|nr:TetR/AcrR family transcriptional regulator [Endomicrobium sp.]
MVRPSQNLDRKLIEFGKEEIIARGIANLSIRQICLDSKINLGMFYYYFKSKENFIKALIKSLNDDLTAIFLAEAGKFSNSFERLKRIVFINVKMMKENHGLIENLIKDTNIFDTFYHEIMEDIFSSWMKFYSALVNECKNDGYLNKDTDTDIMIAIITGSTHNYAKSCEFNGYSDEVYYEKLQKMIDFMMEKLK